MIELLITLKVQIKFGFRHNKAIIRAGHESRCLNYGLISFV